MHAVWFNFANPSSPTIYIYTRLYVIAGREKRERERERVASRGGGCVSYSLHWYRAEILAEIAEVPCCIVKMSRGKKREAPLKWRGGGERRERKKGNVRPRSHAHRSCVYYCPLTRSMRNEFPWPSCRLIRISGHFDSKWNSIRPVYLLSRLGRGRASWWIELVISSRWSV